MNSNNNIDTGLSVGRSTGGKPDSAINKLKTRQNDDMKLMYWLTFQQVHNSVKHMIEILR